jgi:hypothetical protein
MDLSRNGVTGLCVETGEAWAVGTCHGASALVRMVSNVGFWSRLPILHKGVSAYVGTQVGCSTAASPSGNFYYSNIDGWCRKWGLYTEIT